MKLYLSSYKFGDQPEKLAALFGPNKRVGVIFNALDYSQDLNRINKGLADEQAFLKNLGLAPEHIDLRTYFGKPLELAEKLKDFGGLWVRGGNTFVLRTAFKESGLDSWLIAKNSSKDFVYAGYSAGVCVLSPSLKGCDLVDDPAIYPTGYPRETIWAGLNLIDFAFAPHFESDHPESEAVNTEVKYYQDNHIYYKALHDGEAIVIEE